MSFLQLAAGDISLPSRTIGDKAYRLFVLRSLLAPRVSRAWFRFIRDFHEDVGAAPAPSRVLVKPLRSYLRAGLSPRQRLGLILDHYRIARHMFSAEALRTLCDGGALKLAELAGRKNTTFVVSMSASVTASMQREGELVMTIQKRGQGDMLSRLSFSLATVSGERALIIGGLQGPHASARKQVVDATRELHGLRPKDATLLAVRALAQALEVGVVHAVSDAGHVLNKHQDLSKFSRYDEYWLERGASPGGPYGYLFPPLEAPEAVVGARAETKAAIEAGARALIEAQSARNARVHPHAVLSYAA